MSGFFVFIGVGFVIVKLICGIIRITIRLEIFPFLCNFEGIANINAPVCLYRCWVQLIES